MSSTIVFLLVAVILLTLAAARDLATRLIPDGLSIGIFVIGVAARLYEGWQAAAVSFAISVGLFFFLVLLAMRGVLGGGDVKLMAATAAGLPPSETWAFIFYTVMFGGLLGVIYLTAHRFVPVPRLAAGETILRRVAAVEARRLHRRGPLPYAVAIAAGAIVVLFSLPGV